MPMCSFSQSINTEYHLLLTRSMLDSAVDKPLDLGSGGDTKFKLHPLGVGFFGGRVSLCSLHQKRVGLNQHKVCGESGQGGVRLEGTVDYSFKELVRQQRWQNETGTVSLFQSHGDAF